ncbi:hypothetical protein [Pseudoalteromonas lipolytica]|uniref:hypothetical protein n=1 Tax=Pseudoalteromonas lipolytica TaxID=570156 RepID=UPI0030A6304D
MDFFSVISAFTKQIPGIMEGAKAVIVVLGLFVFTISGTTLLKSTSNEKGVRAAAWFGLVISPVLINIQKWMDITSATFYGKKMGAVFDTVGRDFSATNDSLMLFNSAEIIIMAFGWFGFIAGWLKMSEAPKYNQPGIKRKAAAAIVIGMALANFKVSVDIAGGTFGVSDSYEKMKENLTQ